MAVGTATPITDVDGTLIHSVGDQSNKIHKTAFAAAFRDVFNIDTHIDIVPHHGSTDPLILIKVLEVSGVPPEEARAQLPALQQAMLAHFEANRSSAGNGLQLLPGVLQLMQKLKVLRRNKRLAFQTTRPTPLLHQETDGVVTCLVTGNLEPIGWGKMRALGLYEYFSGALDVGYCWCVGCGSCKFASTSLPTAPVFGGFGSDHCSGNTEDSWKDRAELVRIAAQKASAAGYCVTAHYHVGDTPQDILAAEEGGAMAVGVLTGVFDKDQLLHVAKKPTTVVLDNLTCTETFLATVGLL